jgi:hypothetical protein
VIVKIAMKKNFMGVVAEKLSNAIPGGSNHQQSNVVSTKLLCEEESHPASDHAPLLPDQESLMVAAVLRSKCPVTSGGSAILVAPESTVPVGRTVRRLSRALERLTGEAVLTVEFGFRFNKEAAGHVPVTDISTIGGELLADLLLAHSPEKSRSLVARLNGNHSDVLSLVTSGQFSQFLLALKTKFRFIMLEGQSLKDSPESLVLAQCCDGVVLTVEYGRTPLRAIAAAQKVAQRGNVRILGFVLEKRGGRRSAERRA